jgi:hypothetical protein
MDAVVIAIVLAALTPLVLPLIFKRPFFRSVLLSAVVAVLGVYSAVALGWSRTILPLIVVPPLAGLISLLVFKRKGDRPPLDVPRKTGGAKTSPIPGQFNRAQERPRPAIKMKPED